MELNTEAVQCAARQQILESQSVKLVPYQKRLEDLFSVIPIFTGLLIYIVNYESSTEYLNGAAHRTITNFDNSMVGLSELSGYPGSGYLIGLYGLFIVFFSRTIRPLTRGVAFRIMFDDMDYVDRVLQLCLDIYLARESRDFTLEEDLFSKVIFLFRSPETIIKWSRPPDWVGGEALLRRGRSGRRETNL